MADLDNSPVQFQDGLGVRALDRDVTSGDPIERLYISDTFKTVVEQLRERTSRLTNLRHIRFVRIRGLEREKEQDKRLYVLSDAVAGVRLARLLELAVPLQLTIDIDTVLYVLRELLPAVALLHDSRSVTHGAIGPERLIISDKGRLVVCDHMFGAALDKLRLSRARLWQQLRVPMPPAAGVPRFDKRSDVGQVGMVALAMLVGRPLTDEDFPARIPAILDGLTETQRGGRTERLSKEMRSWLERTLPIDSRKPFVTVKEAQTALEEVVASRKGSAPSPSALKALVATLLAELQRIAPPPETVPDVSATAPASLGAPAATVESLAPPTSASPPVAARSTPLAAATTADPASELVVTPTATPDVRVRSVMGEPGVTTATVDTHALEADADVEAAESRRSAGSVDEAPRGFEPGPDVSSPGPKSVPAEPTAAVAQVPPPSQDSQAPPKRRASSKKKAAPPTWHASIGDDEAEEIRRLEAELARLAALEDPIVQTPPDVVTAPVAPKERDLGAVIELDIDLDSLADPGATPTDDGTWVLDVGQSGDAALGEVGAELPSDHAVLPVAHAIAEDVIELVASGPFVVEQFGVDPVTFDLGHSPSTEASEPSPATASREESQLGAAPETRATSLVPPTVPQVRVSESLACSEPAPVREVLSDDGLAFPDGSLREGSEILSTREMEQEAGGEVSALHAEQRAEPEFALVPPPAADAACELEHEPADDTVAAAASADVCHPRLDFESPAEVEVQLSAEGPTAPSSEEVVVETAFVGVAELVGPQAHPPDEAAGAQEVWLATGTDPVGECTFEAPVTIDAQARSRAMNLERDLGALHQPAIWLVPPRWRQGGEPEVGGVGGHAPALWQVDVEAPPPTEVVPQHDAPLEQPSGFAPDMQPEAAIELQFEEQPQPNLEPPSAPQPEAGAEPPLELPSALQPGPELAPRAEPQFAPQAAPECSPGLEPLPELQGGLPPEPPPEQQPEPVRPLAASPEEHQPQLAGSLEDKVEPRRELAAYPAPDYAAEAARLSTPQVKVAVALKSMPATTIAAPAETSPATPLAPPMDPQVESQLGSPAETPLGAGAVGANETTCAEAESADRHSPRGESSTLEGVGASVAESALVLEPLPVPSNELVAELSAPPPLRGPQFPTEHESSLAPVLACDSPVEPEDQQVPPAVVSSDAFEPASHSLVESADQVSAPNPIAPVALVTRAEEAPTPAAVPEAVEDDAPAAGLGPTAQPAPGVEWQAVPATVQAPEQMSVVATVSVLETASVERSPIVEIAAAAERASETVDHVAAEDPTEDVGADEDGFDVESIAEPPAMTTATEPSALPVSVQAATPLESSVPAPPPVVAPPTVAAVAPPPTEAANRMSKRGRRRKKKAGGESLVQKSSFAPVRVERPPMPAPPWLRGKGASPSESTDAADQSLGAATADALVASDGPVGGGTPVASPTVPAVLTAPMIPPSSTRVPQPTERTAEFATGLTDSRALYAVAPSTSQVHPAHEADRATMAPSAVPVPSWQAESRDLSNAPLEVKAQRAPLSVSRVAGLLASAVLVEALLLGAWAWSSRPPSSGRLVVMTRPHGIQVLVDGKVAGETPYEANVPAGRHVVQLTGRSTTRTVNIEVPAGAQGSTFVRWPTEAATGHVTITSIPDGATVTVDGEEHGKAPVTVHDLSVGVHTVRVTGLRGSVETTVDVKADRTVNLEVPIYSGWVSVFSAVPLEISEDGKLLGDTESDRIMLGAGTHRLELSNVQLGYRETHTVQVVPGKVVPLSVELPSAPLFVDVEPGVEVWVDGERVGYTPLMDVRVPIGTRVVLLKRQGRDDERHVVSVRQPGPTRIGSALP